jgi:phosphoribosylglycinamide formyltransferase-1
MKEASQKHIAIFASGAGSNALAIIKHFDKHPTIKVALIITNNKTAGVIQIAKEHRIPFDIINPTELKEEETMLDLLDVYQIDLIVLAGFLLLIPTFLINAYPDRIINIHPALLPKYGGKGMYGKRVHEAVRAANDAETGITIHYVNENYDEGKYITQEKCYVEPSDTVDSIAAKIRALEHTYYPLAIEKLLK